MLIYLTIALIACIVFGAYVARAEKDMIIGMCVASGFFLFLGMIGYAVEFFRLIV